MVNGVSIAEKKIIRACGFTISEFGLIKSGDRVAVALSGGKDSCVMLDTLVTLKRRSPIPFHLVAFTIDQGKFLTNIEAISPFVQSLGVDWHLSKDTPSLRLLEEMPDHGCDLCSRFRRTAVYSAASRLECNVIALGHTADDFAESLLRNILYSGQIHPLPVKAMSTGGEFRIIRPFARVWEMWIEQRITEIGLSVVPCICSLKDGVRKSVRSLIADLDTGHGGVAENILAAAIGKTTKEGAPHLTGIKRK